MDPEKILKQFKNIQPDPTYTDYSRRAILASAQLDQLSVRRILAHVFEAAASVALVGVLIFAIAGGFSGAKYLSPVQFSGIDPAALHAEAQAIDMQINLANLTYTEATHIAASTPQAAGAALSQATTTPAITGTSTAVAVSPTSTAGMASSTTPETTPSSSVSVNEALQKLTE